MLKAHCFHLPLYISIFSSFALEHIDILKPSVCHWSHCISICSSIVLEHIDISKLSVGHLPTLYRYAHRSYWSVSISLCPLLPIDPPHIDMLSLHSWSISICQCSLTENPLGAYRYASSKGAVHIDMQTVSAQAWGSQAYRYGYGWGFRYQFRIYHLSDIYIQNFKKRYKRAFDNS